MTAVAYVLLGPAPVVQLFFLLTAPGTAVRQTLRGILANLLDITQLYCEWRRYKYYKNKASKWKGSHDEFH